MARIRSISTEAVPAPSTGLASILSDHQATIRESKAATNLVFGVVEAFVPYSAIMPLPSELSSIRRAEVAVNNGDHSKEEVILKAGTIPYNPDTRKLSQIQHDHNSHKAASLDSSVNKLDVESTATANVGGMLVFPKDVAEMADPLAMSMRKNRKNTVHDDQMICYFKTKPSVEESVRSFARQRLGRGLSASGTSNVGGPYRRAHELQESLHTSQEKLAFHSLSASQMIPQSAGCVDKDTSSCQSAPVQVPDWSKIIVKASVKTMVMMDDGEEGDKDGERLPPHELLAREYAKNRVTAFSVCEGHGRTLKGRDLSRVRDAVWSQMGFAD